MIQIIRKILIFVLLSLAITACSNSIEENETQDEKTNIETHKEVDQEIQIINISSLFSDQSSLQDANSILKHIYFGWYGRSGSPPLAGGLSGLLFPYLIMIFDDSTVPNEVFQYRYGTRESNQWDVFFSQSVTELIPISSLDKPETIDKTKFKELFLLIDFSHEISFEKMGIKHINRLVIYEHENSTFITFYYDGKYVNGFVLESENNYYGEFLKELYSLHINLTEVEFRNGH